VIRDAIIRRFGASERAGTGSDEENAERKSLPAPYDLPGPNARTSQIFFDAPRRHGLTSGTTMRRHPASALCRNPVPQAVATLLLLASCHAAWPLPRHEKSEIHKEIEALEQQWQQATVTNNIGE